MSAMKSLPVANESLGNYQVNMEGISRPLTSWINVDTGATNRLTSNANWLIDLMLCTTDFSSVQLPNGTQSKVTYIGCIEYLAVIF